MGGEGSRFLLLSVPFFPLFFRLGPLLSDECNAGERGEELIYIASSFVGFGGVRGVY